jgi:circadian clock protein KaiC
MANPRIPTGIAGLDALLHGGFVRNRSYLLVGATGTGKTIACLQFMLANLAQGEKAVYVTVDERPGEIVDSAASFGWDLQPFVQDKQLAILDASPYFGGRNPAGGEKGIDPQKIIADLGNYVRRLAATLLIIDPLTPFILPPDATSPAQDQARSLIQLVHTQINTTNIFTGHLTPAGQGGIEEHLVAGVLWLRTSEEGERIQRSLTVKKMRGSAVEPVRHPIVMAKPAGIELAQSAGADSACAETAPAVFEFFELGKKA